MKTNFLNSLASGIITSTLIFTPSIFAKSNSEVNPKIEQLKKVLNQGQYETAKSYAEVWNNIKNLVPPEHKEGTGNIFAYLNQGNFPKMKFQEFTYKGKTAIKSVVQLGGEQVVFEYLLNGNEFMKVNGILLTENDMQSTSAVYAKIGHLSFLKKDYQAYKKAVFAKSFIPDLKTWNRLTKKEKATYLLRYRELLEASKKVFNHYPDKIVASRSPASESFVKAFLGEDSFAKENDIMAEPTAETIRVQELKKAQEAAKEVAADVRNKASFFLGKGQKDPHDKRRRAPSCIIAGYAMEWEGNNCVWRPEKDAIFGSPESKKCQSMNNNDSYIACQPIVYHTGNGDPVCIKADAKLTSFQQATHPNGPCEKDSKLETADDKKKFIDGWLKKMEDTGKIEKGKYKGLIQVQGESVVTRNTELFDKITNELIQPLNEYITSAENICTKDDSEGKYKYIHTNRPNNNKKNEKKKDPAYQDGACDGLLKRALAVQHLLNPSSSQGEVLASDACKDWNPPDGVEKDSSKNTCKCKSGYTLDAKKKNTCILKPIPVVHVPDKDVTTVDLINNPPPPPRPSDDCEFYQTANTENQSCSVSPLFKWGGLALGAIGACFLFKLDLCVKDKKKPIPIPAPEYKDPVPTPVDPGTTVVTKPPPTLPKEPPRNEPPPTETQVNPNKPNGNESSVPSGVR